MKAKKLVKLILFVIVFSGFYIQSMDGVGQEPKNETTGRGGCGPLYGNCVE